jgi:hypothetical protein
VGTQYNRIGFGTLSNRLFVCVVVCLLGGFPAHSALATDTQCLIGAIDLTPASGVITGLKNDTDCEANYPAACDKGATILNNNCKTQCSSQKQYTNSGQQCMAKLPVTTHRPQYIKARDCELRADENAKWAVSCAVTAPSCTCIGN